VWVRIIRNVQALNAKFKKPLTAVLLPLLNDDLKRHLGCFSRPKRKKL
jgi:hypothetical protein